ncbi:MAG: HipA domain-containing protein [Micrococcus sp.]|nr:HipA domain-containing protein [Micrococcus sp.]
MTEPAPPPLEDLRYAVRADVYKAGVLAASLTRTPAGETEFAYADDYQGADVAFTLPCSTIPVVTPGGGLPPFFAGLLPEGHRLTVLRHAVKSSADDELSLLLAVGADVPGDVQIVPAGSPPMEPPALSTEDPADLDFRSLAALPDRHGLPGMQAKASASMINTPLALAGSRAILKLDPAEHPHLVANEALHLTHAARLGLDVARHALVKDAHQVPGLLVTRFDRVPEAGGQFRRLALEDASQVLGIVPAAKYAVSAEDVALALVARSSAPRVAARNLYLQFLFAWLTGNGDLHAKNVSILQSLDRQWQIAPMYDLPSTVVYRDMSMALRVDGRNRGLRRRHWDAFGAALDLPQRATRAAQALALSAAGTVDLSLAGFEGSVLRGAERELRHRRYELEG